MAVSIVFVSGFDDVLVFEVRRQPKVRIVRKKQGAAGVSVAKFQTIDVITLVSPVGNTNVAADLI